MVIIISMVMDKVLSTDNGEQNHKNSIFVSIITIYVDDKIILCPSKVTSFNILTFTQ